MKIILYIIAALSLAGILTVAYARLAPVDPAAWHVDPEEVTPPETPNFALLAGPSAVSVAVQPLAVAGRLQSIAEAEGARVIAGSLGEGFVTYIARSRLFGFADFVTIRLVPEEDETRLHVFSRARHGQSDLGVNTARVQRWLTAARDEESGT